MTCEILFSFWLKLSFKLKCWIYVSLQILFDSDCPVCVTEVKFLKWWSRKDNPVNFVDITKGEYKPEDHMGITFEEAMGNMHAITPDKKVLPSQNEFNYILSTFHFHQHIWMKSSELYHKLFFIYRLWFWVAVLNWFAHEKIKSNLFVQRRTECCMKYNWAGPIEKGAHGFSNVMQANDVNHVIYDVTIGNAAHNVTSKDCNIYFLRYWRKINMKTFTVFEYGNLPNKHSEITISPLFAWASSNIESQVLIFGHAGLCSMIYLAQIQ